MGSPSNSRGAANSGSDETDLTPPRPSGADRAGLVAGAPGLARAAAPQGQLTWAMHVSLAPTWFDPAETPGIITPFMVLYALHDAMVKPMPGKLLAPSLAESWSTSEDGLTYEFVLRDGRQVPQRRAGHRRGRQVLVRALSRRRRTTDEGNGWRRSRRPIRSMSASSSRSRGPIS